MKKDKKIRWLHPRLPFCSTTLLTVYDEDHNRTNIISISDILVCCFKPLYIAVCIRPKRYSHGLVLKALEFCVNIPGSSLLKEVDLCGNYSGRNTDKFKKFGLTPIPCRIIKTEAIEQCFGHIECRLENPDHHIIHLGEHTVFISKVVASWANEYLLDKKGQIKLNSANPIIYIAHQREMGGLGKYHLMGDRIGTQGFSLKPKK
jgi:flavin reductase (DIM6/NTAB) family NADH-FMN oxidoreductase RutF